MEKRPPCSSTNDLPDGEGYESVRPSISSASVRRWRATLVQALSAFPHSELFTGQPLSGSTDRPSMSVPRQSTCRTMMGTTRAVRAWWRPIARLRLDVVELFARKEVGADEEKDEPGVLHFAIGDVSHYLAGAKLAHAPGLNQSAVLERGQVGLEDLELRFIGGGVRDEDVDGHDPRRSSASMSKSRPATALHRTEKAN